MSDTVGNYTSEAAEKARDIAAHLTRKAGKRYARARDAAVDGYDEAHDRAMEYPHITLGIGVACGFLLGAFLARHR